jgi:hypothetical protein
LFLLKKSSYVSYEISSQIAFVCVRIVNPFNNVTFVQLFIFHTKGLGDGRGGGGAVILQKFQSKALWFVVSP